MRYNKRARLAIGLAGAMLLAACSSGAADPTSTPTVAPVPATEPPSVVPAAPEGMFTGRVHLRQVETPAGGDPNAIYYVGNQVATDPRQAGTLDLQLSLSDAQAGQMFTAWGPSTITNDQGTWVCNEAGTGVADQPSSVFVRDVACVGKGKYIGLSAWMHGVSSNVGADWGFIGWIAKT